jgi:myosin-crossreactive antigen
MKNTQHHWRNADNDLTEALSIASQLGFSQQHHGYILLSNLLAQREIVLEKYKITSQQQGRCHFFRTYIWVAWSAGIAADKVRTTLNELRRKVEDIKRREQPEEGCGSINPRMTG